MTAQTPSQPQIHAQGPHALAMPCIALVGNPNCGKTALFNLLTGARQKWPITRG